MSVNRIAARYAQTLISAAQEQNILEEIYQDLLQVQQLIEGNDELRRFLKSPVIQNAKKADGIVAIFESHLKPMTVSYLRLICEKGRAPQLSFIIRVVGEKYRAIKDITQVEVRSAASLDEETLQKLENSIRQLKGVRSKIEMNHSIHPDLLGGFVIQFEDKVYDASVSHQIQKLRKKIAD